MVPLLMATEEKGYEFFDHTADIGIRARGRTFGELLTHLAQGLIQLLAEDSRIELRQSRPIRLEAEDAEALTVQWLQELLFWFSTDRFLPGVFQLEDAEPTGLRGVVRGEPFDPSRHVPGREVKAITRHLLRVRHVEGRWEAQVIVDI